MEEKGSLVGFMSTTTKKDKLEFQEFNFRNILVTTNVTLTRRAEEKADDRAGH